MKYLLFLFTTLSIFACSQNPQNAGNQSKNVDYLTFKFSQDMATTDMRDPSNWCASNFGEPAFINADPKNFFRRVFALSDIPSRVIVDYGKMSAAFMLLKSGNHVEVFTSDNQPACLSNKAKFQISTAGTTFNFNNKQGIGFDVSLQELPNGIQIVIDFPQDSGYGLSVYRCETCK